MTIADGLNGLRIGSVQQGVHLTTLELTEPGDVFFLLSDPGHVIGRFEVARDYPFLYLGDDVWRAVGRVGNGDPKQRVMVLHNTRGE